MNLSSVLCLVRGHQPIRVIDQKKISRVGKSKTYLTTYTAHCKRCGIPLAATGTEREVLVPRECAHSLIVRDPDEEAYRKVSS